MTSPTKDAAHWDRRYSTGDTPWDSQLVSRQLMRFLDDDHKPPGLAVELGSGTGTNALFLAERGFDVLAIDFSPVAVATTQTKAAAAHRTLLAVTADLCQLDSLKRTLGQRAEQYHHRVSLLFDRGCFHCARRENLPGYLTTLEWLAAPDARMLLLCGNSNEPGTGGPPRLAPNEIRSDLESLFVIERMEEFRFEDRGGLPGPLGWSVSLRRPPVSCHVKNMNHERFIA